MSWAACARKYLRVRGEESSGGSLGDSLKEIPPRARRRVPFSDYSCTPSGKYLRVRGEEPVGAGKLARRKEIPPRARRRAGFLPNRLVGPGNTSACAEKSGVVVGWTRCKWKYLRVRGEEFDTNDVTREAAEIPPRARRRAMWGSRGKKLMGNTSA